MLQHDISSRAGHFYLSETVGLGGAQRLIGQLQQLLRALQGLGTGTQLTLRKTQAHNRPTESHLQIFTRSAVV